MATSILLVRCRVWIRLGHLMAAVRLKVRVEVMVKVRFMDS